MKTYVALLRGINVAGRKRVAMEDLRSLFLASGSEDVRTYLQSGNVVFRSPATPSELVQTIEESVERVLGLEVTVLLRTKEQLSEVIDRSPFAGSGIEPSKLHVTFLAEAPAAERVRKPGGKRAGPDEFQIHGREIYLHCPNGYGKTKLNNAFFERQLGVAATTRNWKTVTKLAELASGG